MKIFNQHVNDLEIRKIVGIDSFNNSILDGWKYRKSTTVNRASGAINDYQMKLLVGESSGASGEEVDCGGKCLSNFNDLRFTKLDGKTLLPYFIESVTGTTPNQLATVWIKFDEILTSATRIYMYYGNSGASSYSNGTNTFIKFDDFERGNDGDPLGSAWTTGGTAVISTSQAFRGTRSLKLAGINGATSSTARLLGVTRGDNLYAIQLRVFQKTGIVQTNYYHGNGTKLINAMTTNIGGVWYYDTGAVNTGSSISMDQWQLMEFKNINFTSSTYDIFANGLSAKDNAGMMTNSGTINLFTITSYNPALGADVFIDNVIVRNWRTVEPVWSGTWSGEEIL